MSSTGRRHSDKLTLEVADLADLFGRGGRNHQAIPRIVELGDKSLDNLAFRRQLNQVLLAGARHVRTTSDQSLHDFRRARHSGDRDVQTFLPVETQRLGELGRQVTSGAGGSNQLDGNTPRSHREARAAGEDRQKRKKDESPQGSVFSMAYLADAREALTLT